MQQIGTLAPRSNRASWSESVQIYDDDTSEPLDISGATEIKLQVKDRGSTVLSASLSGSTITIEEETGVFSFVFTADQMGALCAKTYDIGAVVTVSGLTEQIIIGKLPVLEGYVT